ncbi:MAG TPA: 50S ribosomal protein L24 [Candidatus Limnocylindrales bacterium]|jgi:large subunit ribosomal protein L24|nr:50S ribosomal protein L24 [Candidatus Limnocylindrales bacterium]
MAQPEGRSRPTRVPDIHRGDEVVVLKGKDAGKRGTVERVVRNPQMGRRSRIKLGGDWRSRKPLAALSVVVEGLNIAKRHTKPRPKQGRTERQPRIQQGGILEIAQPIHVSNVQIVCPSCGKPTRVRHTEAADGRSLRVCSHCGEGLTREAQKS